MGGQCRSQERVTEIFFTFKRVGFSSGSARARVLPLWGSRAQAQPLWRMGPDALRHVGSSRTGA